MLSLLQDLKQEDQDQEEEEMEFLNRNSHHRDIGYNSLQLTVSPMSRRRSVSPLLSPATGTISPQILQRNRQEASFPLNDDEKLLTFQEKIMFSQEKTLLPLAHDLADWINSVLGKVYLSSVKNIIL